MLHKGIVFAFCDDYIRSDYKFYLAAKLKVDSCFKSTLVIK